MSRSRLWVGGHHRDRDATTTAAIIMIEIWLIIRIYLRIISIYNNCICILEYMVVNGSICT